MFEVAALEQREEEDEGAGEYTTPKDPIPPGVRCLCSMSGGTAEQLCSLLGPIWLGVGLVGYTVPAG